MARRCARDRPQATGRGDRGGLAFTQPPTDGNDDIDGEDSDEGNDGYISLYSAPNGKAWHDLSFSQVKALARRARSHHNTGTANTQNGDATDNFVIDEAPSPSSAEKNTAIFTIKVQFFP